MGGRTLALIDPPPPFALQPPGLVRTREMDPLLLALLLAAVLVVAFLYSSVGHAGASGYIAVMSLAGLAPEEIRPTALVLPRPIQLRP